MEPKKVGGDYQRDIKLSVAESATGIM